ITESLKAARSALRGASGIYCFTCTDTGSMYIGSSIDMGGRLVEHVVGDKSNTHLQFAIAKYGLSAFIFSVIELCAKDLLLAREQHWLNWLFSLPSNFRYNFLPTAGSWFGYKHTSATKAMLRARKLGLNNPMYGAVSPMALTVSVYTLDMVLVQMFFFSYSSGQMGFLGVSHQAMACSFVRSLVPKAIKRGHTVNGLYRVFNER
ncbi:hypothetical protein BC938DRAFT_476864, partial [Jimgerdemannia flammicorona]